jgi:hypothetical protein
MTEQTDYLKEMEPFQDEDLAIGLKILAFIIPLAGAIMYFKHKSTAPKKSKSACYSALGGIGFSLIVNILAGLAGA